MKMVKSLLLGSAAGIVAVAGVQAADLPVRAKAAEYVKVIAHYGAGFYYIPGTDIAMKVGGYVRSDYFSGDSSKATSTFGPQITQASTSFTKIDQQPATTPWAWTVAGLIPASLGDPAVRVVPIVAYTKTDFKYAGSAAA